MKWWACRKYGKRNMIMYGLAAYAVVSLSAWWVDRKVWLLLPFSRACFPSSPLIVAALGVCGVAVRTVRGHSW